MQVNIKYKKRVRKLAKELYGKPYSKRFQEFLDELNVKNRNKQLHSAEFIRQCFNTERQTLDTYIVLFHKRLIKEKKEHEAKIKKLEQSII